MSCQEQEEATKEKIPAGIVAILGQAWSFLEILFLQRYCYRERKIVVV